MLDVFTIFFLAKLLFLRYSISEYVHADHIGISFA